METMLDYATESVKTFVVNTTRFSNAYRILHGIVKQWSQISKFLVVKSCSESLSWHECVLDNF